MLILGVWSLVYFSQFLVYVVSLHSVHVFLYTMFFLKHIYLCFIFSQSLYLEKVSYCLLGFLEWIECPYLLCLSGFFSYQIGLSKFRTSLLCSYISFRISNVFRYFEDAWMGRSNRTNLIKHFPELDDEEIDIN